MQQLLITEPWTVFFRIVGVLLMVGGIVGFIIGVMRLVRDAQDALADLSRSSSRKRNGAQRMPTMRSTLSAADSSNSSPDSRSTRERSERFF